MSQKKVESKNENKIQEKYENLMKDFLCELWPEDMKSVVEVLSNKEVIYRMIGKYVKEHESIKAYCKCSDVDFEELLLGTIESGKLVKVISVINEIKRHLIKLQLENSDFPVDEIGKDVLKAHPYILEAAIAHAENPDVSVPENREAIVKYLRSLL